MVRFASGLFVMVYTSFLSLLFSFALDVPQNKRERMLQNGASVFFGVMNPRMNAGGLSLPLHTPLILPTALPDETVGCMTSAL